MLFLKKNICELTCFSGVANVKVVVFAEYLAEFFQVLPFHVVVRPHHVSRIQPFLKKKKIFAGKVVRTKKYFLTAFTFISMSSKYRPSFPKTTEVITAWMGS